MVLPEVAPVVVAEAAAVPMSLPAVAGVVSSTVLAGGIAPGAAPLAGEETVTVGVIFSDGYCERTSSRIVGVGTYY